MTEDQRRELACLLIPPQLREFDSKPDYLRIYHFYRELILLGTIPQNAKLPSIRALAHHMGISRNPVEVAYAHLVAEGYIVNKPKSGYFTAPVLQKPLVAQKNTDLSVSTPIPQKQQANASPGTAPNQENRPQNGNGGELGVDFAYDRIQSDFFPLNVWKKLTQRTLREAGPDLFSYGDQTGELQLRRSIQSYVRQNRGVVCKPEQIIVTSGTQQSALVISLLLRSEQRPLGVEAAMHPGLFRIFDQQLRSLIPIQLEQDGINCDALDRSGPLCGVYVTPSHQFPYGSILPMAKRIRLLQWASNTDSWIVEDDYDSEFIYDGQPLPALQGMDRSGRVIYMGTFSKALAPALRLGYLILPPELLARYEYEFSSYDGTASRLTQITMARFLEEGHLDRHIRKMRTIYNTNRKILIAAVACNFKEHAYVTGASSGLHMHLAVRTSLSAKELLERGRKAGIGVRPVTDFHVTAKADAYKAEEGNGFVIGYGGVSAEQIEEGIRGLAVAWECSS